MSLVFAVALILVIGGLVMVVSGRWSAGMPEAERDVRPPGAGEPAFDVALRGYRMDEVDARIEQLERENAALRARRGSTHT
jgi:hypothetical protein